MQVQEGRGLYTLKDVMHSLGTLASLQYPRVPTRVLSIPTLSRSRADVSTSAMQWKHYWSSVFAFEAALHRSPHGDTAISVCGCCPVEVQMDHRSWVAVSHCGLGGGRGERRVRRDQYIHV